MANPQDANPGFRPAPAAKAPAQSPYTPGRMPLPPGVPLRPDELHLTPMERAARAQVQAPDMIQKAAAAMRTDRAMN